MPQAYSIGRVCPGESGKIRVEIVPLNARLQIVLDEQEAQLDRAILAHPHLHDVAYLGGISKYATGRFRKSSTSNTTSASCGKSRRASAAGEKH